MSSLKKIFKQGIFMFSYIYISYIHSNKSCKYVCAHTYRHILYIKYVFRCIYMHHHRHNPQNFTYNPQENPWRTLSNNYNKKVLEVTRKTSRLYCIWTECYCRAKMHKFFSKAIRTMDIKNILNREVNDWVDVEEKEKEEE